MGIGGGFLMNIYVHNERKAYTLNAKEVAPRASTPNMFKSRDDYNSGPLSIAVPGEVNGYWELHQKYGKLNWKSLVEPSIKVCREKQQISKHMSDCIQPDLLQDAHLRYRNNRMHYLSVYVIMCTLVT